MPKDEDEVIAASLAAEIVTRYNNLSPVHFSNIGFHLGIILDREYHARRAKMEMDAYIRYVASHAFDCGKKFDGFPREETIGLMRNSVVDIYPFYKRDWPRYVDVNFYDIVRFRAVEDTSKLERLFVNTKPLNKTTFPGDDTFLIYDREKKPDVDFDGFGRAIDLLPVKDITKEQLVFLVGNIITTLTSGDFRVLLAVGYKL